MTDKSSQIRAYIGIAIAVVSLALSFFIKIDGLPDVAVKALGVLIATLAMQIFESFNLCLSCLLSSVLLLLLGCVATPTEAFSGYANHILYFTIASFGISAAFQKSVVSRKLLAVFMKSNKMTTKKVTLIFMFTSALLSSVMSNVAAVVIFLPYLDQYLSHYKDEEAKKRSSRCMNICIVVSSMIGGMITPAGSSVNLIGLDLLQKYADTTVRFIDWIAFGLPLAIVMLFVAFFIITLVFKPDNLSSEELSGFIQYLKDTPKAKKKDVYISLLIIVTLITWILSSWFPAINITAVAVISLILLFVPGLEVLTWEEFSVVNSWNAFFVAGNHITLASVAISTGLCSWLAETLFKDIGNLPLTLMLIVVAAITFLFMAIIPAAPACATILVPILIQCSFNSEINPVLLFMTTILCIPNIYLFPLDAPLVVAYDRKAFTMFELPKATVWIQLSMIVIVAFMVQLIFGVLY